jgi:hypothetical protein
MMAWLSMGVWQVSHEEVGPAFIITTPCLIEFIGLQSPLLSFHSPAGPSPGQRLRFPPACTTANSMMLCALQNPSSNFVSVN